ncbi:MAG: flagellar brake protein [Pseudomonadota bacterium]|nr:flagellar brake protein [Pseudomonadota bacterium]
MYEIDLGTPLQVQLEKMPDRFKSVLVGVDPGQYMIIHQPLAENAKAIFVPGKTIVVRFLHRGSVYGFQAEIICVVEVPAALLLIKYPAKIEDHNLRNHKRVDCYLPSHLLVGKMTFNSRIIDLSKGGCQVALEISEMEGISNPMDVDQQVNLSFCLPGLVDELNLEGVVKKILNDKNQIKIGLKFNEIEAKYKAKFYEFLAHAGA